jgi:hypothetical protein
MGVRWILRMGISPRSPQELPGQRIYLPQTLVWRSTLGHTRQLLKQSGFTWGGNQGSKSMEVADVGNAVDASICGFSRRSPSPGQPRLPEYATRKGYFLTFDEHRKAAFQSTRLPQLQRACWATLVLLLEGSSGSMLLLPELCCANLITPAWLKP